MTDSVFDQNTLKTTTTVAPIGSPDVLADKLKSIVNKDGQPKYNDIEKALDALVHSQTHIERLEAEAAERNAELEKVRTRAAEAEALETIIERLRPTNPEEKKTTSTTGTSEAATVAQLEEVIERGLQRREAMKQAQDNLKLVNDTLLAKFGGDMNKTKEAVAAKAQELGLSPANLAALSSQSPAAVLAYFGETAGRASPTVSSSTTLLSPPSNDDELKRPEKSLLLGAKTKDQKAFMAEIRKQVYKKHGITE